MSLTSAARVQRARDVAARLGLVLRRAPFRLDRPDDGGYFLVRCRLEGARCTHVEGHPGWHDLLLGQARDGVGIALVEQALRGIEAEMRRAARPRRRA